MLVREKCYTLQNGADFNVTIHPCCTIEIDIPEQRQYLRPSLDELHFKLTREGMKLVVYQQEGGIRRAQELHFARADGMALCHLINEVVEQHEDLMSALC